MKTLVDISSLYHESDSRFAYPTGKNSCRIVLLTKKNDANIRGISLLYQGKYRGSRDRKKIILPILYSDALHDYYGSDLTLDDVRIEYVFEIEDIEGNIIYFSEAGVSSSFQMEESSYNVFQLPYINSSDIISVNEKFVDRVFYQIFPDRFARDPSIPHSKKLIKWGEPPSMTNFAGGNIKGIIAKIPYLKELGIGGLYLNPLFKASTNHKYDTLEYGKVDPDFGTNEDLVELVEKCHEQDILVVLDIVYNHMSFLNPIFQDVCKKGRDSKYYDWFLIDGDFPSFIKGNYASFGIRPYMPKINLSNEECAEYFLNLSEDIVNKYKVDGFRLDVGDEVAHSFWRQLARRMKKMDPSFLLIGEDWHNAESFLNAGDQFDSVMNYALTRLSQEFFAQKKYGSSEMVEEIYGMWGRYKEMINHNLLNLIDSHDKARFLDECDGKLDAYLSAYLFLIMFPGLPSIYYGDEIAMHGVNAIDCRRCFPWDDIDDHVLGYFKKMIDIRNSFPLSECRMKISSDRSLLKIQYENDGKVLSIYWNNTSKDEKVLCEEELLSLNYKDGHLGEDGFLVSLKR